MMTDKEGRPAGRAALVFGGGAGDGMGNGKATTLLLARVRAMWPPNSVLKETA